MRPLGIPTPNGLIPLVPFHTCSLLEHEPARKDKGVFRNAGGDGSCARCHRTSWTRRAVCVKPSAGLAISRVAHEAILVYYKSGSPRCAVADSCLLLATLIAEGTKEEIRKLTR